MNALIVGYGSIGQRHARLLRELGCRTAVVSARQVDFSIAYSDIAEALASEQPEYVVIANSTDRHHDTLSTLSKLGYTENVLVEKPVFDRCMPIPPHAFKAAFVAYNIRFHPVIQRLKTLLAGERILAVQTYAGQYLPDWRPTVDYRRTYSARAAEGGGALRDLSHELDYLTWMLGGWKRVNAVGGHFSSLEISSDDVFALTLVTPACPIVAIQLNYLDRLARRFTIINTCRHTIEADLIRGNIIVDNGIENFTVERDDTYRAMHQSFLSGGHGSLCTLDQGLETLRLIESAELASAREEWVTNRAFREAAVSSEPDEN